MYLFNIADYKFDNCIYRCSDCEVAPHKKEILLKECLSYFVGDGELPSLNEFKYKGKIEDKYENVERCLCSHKIKNKYEILHKETNKSFLIGSDCFQKLYGEEALYFFKETCLHTNCEDKVMEKKSAWGKRGFCSDFCMNDELYTKKCLSCKKPFVSFKRYYRICYKCYLKKLQEKF